MLLYYTASCLGCQLGVGKAGYKYNKLLCELRQYNKISIVIDSLLRVLQCGETWVSVPPCTFFT